jgi:hypothetical protein
MKQINSKSKTVFLAAVFSQLLFTISALAAEVTARIDRANVVEGETITLILQTDNPQQSLAADFATLRQDFEILDQRSETQMSIANGRQVAVVRLMLTLEPRRNGELTIPALTFQGASTAPIRVSVEPAPELAPGQVPPVFIELTLDPEDGPYYVHAQLALTVRIFYQQNLTEAAINPPAPSQASVRLLDEIPFQSTRNGVRFRVLERRYAIFPERSGELNIPPLTLSGRLIERPADRLWQPSVRGRRVTVESEPLTLSVLPKPAEYTGDHWLPARRITLSQQISDADTLQVGEPVTRTVILDAVGLEENMIEEPRWPEMQNARIYPDQPQGISRDDEHWVLGHKEFRYAVVPEQAGELVLPEIRLDWWDTTTNRTAVLPEHRIMVEASELVSDLREAAALAAVTPTHLPGGTVDSLLVSSMQRWRLLALVFAVLWLGTMGMLLRRGARVKLQSSSEETMPADEQGMLAELKQACKGNDSKGARNVLSRWLRRHGPALAQGSMMEFAVGIEDQSLRKAIYRFDAGEFSATDQADWDGTEFWKLFSAWQKSSKNPTKESDAEPSLWARG